MHSTLPAAALRWLFIPFIAVMAAMSMVGGPLKSEAAPNGIITLELCALASGCEDILRTWTPRQREYAMLGLGLDYLYMVLYPAVMASALLVTARTLPTIIQTAATVMAWMLVLAGLADAVENFLLIQMLMTGETTKYAMPAAVFASGKFLVIALALVLLAAAAVMRVARRSDAS